MHVALLFRYVVARAGKAGDCTRNVTTPLDQTFGVGLRIQILRAVVRGNIEVSRRRRVSRAAKNE